MLALGMSEQQEFRHELEATLAAREEMGEELEPQLVDRFADRIEQEIDRRAKEQAYRQRPPLATVARADDPARARLARARDPADRGCRRHWPAFAGVLAVCIAIVLVNLLLGLRPRR